MAMKPLLVGEANPYGGDPSFALYPDPPGCAGHRLCHKIMGLDQDEYLERFERVNLCPTAWSMRTARQRAGDLARASSDRTLVLFGAKVAAAFDLQFEPFEKFGAVRPRAGADRPLSAQDWVPHFVVLPHPSGLSRAWHVPGAYERARGVLREAGVL